MDAWQLSLEYTFNSSESDEWEAMKERNDAEGTDIEHIKISLHRVFERLGLLNHELFIQRSRMSKVDGKVLC